MIRRVENACAARPSWLVALTFLVISGVATVWRPRRSYLLMASLAALTIGLRWVSVEDMRPGLAVVDPALGAVVVFTFAALILTRVFSPGAVTVARIEGP